MTCLRSNQSRRNENEKDTVTLKTDTLAELMSMALLAANAGLLPANAYEEWFKLRFRREIELTIDGSKNGWGHEDIGALNGSVDSWVRCFEAQKKKWKKKQKSKQQSVN